MNREQQERLALEIARYDDLDLCSDADQITSPWTTYVSPTRSARKHPRPFNAETIDELERIQRQIDQAELDLANQHR